MRLPDAQIAALQCVNHGRTYQVYVVKWNNPTHLFGYRVQELEITVGNVTVAKTIAKFDESTDEGLLICTAYERLVLAMYADDLRDIEAAGLRINNLLERAASRALAGEGDPHSDKTLLIFGNVADGLSFVGPFDHSADADEWAEKNARGEDWIMTNLKHPEA